MLEDLGAKFQLSQKIIPRFDFKYDHLEIFFWKEKCHVSNRTYCKKIFRG